jgi:hypothetical protein
MRNSIVSVIARRLVKISRSFDLLFVNIRKADISASITKANCNIAAGIPYSVAVFSKPISEVASPL